MGKINIKATLTSNEENLNIEMLLQYDQLFKKIALFIDDENIREYLGSNGGVNKKIVDTLRDPLERNNFFFYNNGITIIADNYTGETS